jgi:hypothetical protein
VYCVFYLLSKSIFLLFFFFDHDPSLSVFSVVSSPQYLFFIYSEFSLDVFKYLVILPLKCYIIDFFDNIYFFFVYFFSFFYFVDLKVPDKVGVDDFYYFSIQFSRFFSDFIFQYDKPIEILSEKSTQLKKFNHFIKISKFNLENWISGGKACDYLFEKGLYNYRNHLRALFILFSE